MLFFSWVKEIFALRNILKIFGSRVFSTVFYIGYLPDWNRHWTAFFSVIMSVVFIYNIAGFSAKPELIAYYMLLKFIYLSVFSWVLVPLFKYSYRPANLEIITIDAYLAQVLMFALSVPAILHINSGIISLMTRACNSFLYCSDLVFGFSSLFLTLLGPYLLLRFFDAMEFWPTANLFLYYKNNLIRLFAGLVPALYAIFTIYLFSLLFFDLEIGEIISFYRVVFKLTYFHLILAAAILLKFFKLQNLYILAKKIGVIGLLDRYGLINQNHYDLKFNLK